MNNYEASAQSAVDGAKDLIESSGISAADLASTTYGANGLITPQDLSPLLTDLSMRETSFFDRVNKTRGVGAAATFNLLEELFAVGENTNPNELLYGDGGLPARTAPRFNNIVNPYKDLGLTGKVTGRSLRQMNGQLDLEATNVKATMQKVRQGIDWLSFWSRDDVTNSNNIAGYKGLDQLITTNVVDAQGATISEDLINAAARKIGYQGGSGQLSHVFASYGVGLDLNKIYRSSNQFVVNMPGANRADVTLGDPLISKIQTVVGTPDLVPSYFINPGLPYQQGQPYSASSANNGVGTSTVFLLAMNFIEYRELLPMSKIDLAVVADKKEFMVIESGTVILRAEPFCAKIINVAESTA